MQVSLSAGWRRRLLIVVALCLLLLLATAAVSEAAPSESGGYYYRVHYGDTLYSIALRSGTTVAAIMQANPHIPHPNLVFAGMVIWVPGHSYGYPPPQPGYCRQYHYVTWGQQLGSIARWYGTTVWAIAQANNLANINRIYAGTYLCIP